MGARRGRSPHFGPPELNGRVSIPAGLGWGDHLTDATIQLNGMFLSQRGWGGVITRPARASRFALVSIPAGLGWGDHHRRWPLRVRQLVSIPAGLGWGDHHVDLPESIKIRFLSQRGWGGVITLA